MGNILLAVLASATLAAALPATDEAIRHAVASPARDEKLVARDVVRHPAEELSFFGVRPTSTVVEVWPGGGYWTQILAPLLHDHGVYYAAFGPTDGDSEERLFAAGPGFQRMLQDNPSIYGKTHVTEFGAHHPEMAPRGSTDFVLTFRNLHNWISEGSAPAMLAAINRALKPGGVLGIEDHRGSASIPQDPKAASGYVRQDYAIRLIERAGFKLVASSEINANPRDTTIWPKGVWTLPPVLALKDQDREKYLAVGEADNFVLKFRKVRN
ncbi:class I SAM-dependent methyltransferase [Sphingomonas echinoides]|uniref:class I SAM-dependent methyltransferase n=1 Tax=Sphingomonas echinoides TaxID=59803 RepID=UPI003EEC8600